MTASRHTTWRVKSAPEIPGQSDLARLAARLEVSPLLVRLMALRDERAGRYQLDDDF